MSGADSTTSPPADPVPAPVPAPEPTPEPTAEPTPAADPPATSTPTEATLHTLLPRLRRLEHLLSGSTETPAHTLTSHTSPPLIHQLHHLRSSLDHLLASYPSLRGLLALHGAFPELFAPASAPAASPAEKAAVLTAQAPLMQSVAGALGSLRDTPLPDTAESARLVALLPRIEKVEVRLGQQGEKVAELRERTAKVLESWWRTGVLGVNECFAEWDERVFDVEREVRRREREVEGERKVLEA